MADKEIRLDFYNEDGTLKSFDSFASELKEVYDQLEGVTINKFMKLLTGPQSDYSPLEVLDKYHFLDRKLYLNNEIDEKVASAFLEKIQFWNAEDDFNNVPVEDRGVIQIYINTPGGSLLDTWQIIDAIQGSKTPVVTIVTGVAYSAGFFITLAGHERYAFPHASFLFHQGSNLIVGDAHKAIQQADNYKDMLKILKKYVLKHTKITSDIYDKHKPDDWYINTAQALKYGIIDGICNDVNGEIDESITQEENFDGDQ